MYYQFYKEARFAMCNYRPKIDRNKDISIIFMSEPIFGLDYPEIERLNRYFEFEGYDIAIYWINSKIELVLPEPEKNSKRDINLNCLIFTVKGRNTARIEKVIIKMYNLIKKGSLNMTTKK